MFLDNGLTLDEQERMDNIYESLMSDLKTVNIKLYQTLRANELTEKDVMKLIYSKKEKVVENEQGQYQLFEEEDENKKS
tara:strand:- start:312 stop:548 length:237 start_codon:yes stop_codon:yes gene_type:complete